MSKAPAAAKIPWVRATIKKAISGIKSSKAFIAKKRSKKRRA